MVLLHQTNKKYPKGWNKKADCFRNLGFEEQHRSNSSGLSLSLSLFFLPLLYPRQDTGLASNLELTRTAKKACYSYPKQCEKSDQAKWNLLGNTCPTPAKHQWKNCTISTATHPSCRNRWLYSNSPTRKQIFHPVTTCWKQMVVPWVPPPGGVDRVGSWTSTLLLLSSITSCSMEVSDTLIPFLGW